LIICETIGGLNDRLKFLISAMRSDNHIKLIWSTQLEHKTSVWLWCTFEDLFTNDFEVFKTKTDCIKKYGSKNDIFSGSCFAKIEKDDIELNKMSVVDSTFIVPKKQKDSVLKQINKLRPVEYIRNVVDEFKSKFDENTITFSIRTFMDAERNHHSNGQYFNIDAIFKKMDSYKNKTFFVTCDHQETFDKIFDRYGDRIIHTPKRTHFGDYKTLEGIQDSVVDLFLGGQTNHLVFTRGSGFCEMQWWFGGCKTSLESIDAHGSRL